MPLVFPIAATAREALDAEDGARTLAEARTLAGTPVALVLEWLRPAGDERAAVQARAEACLARGFVQIYEDTRGQPVIAVSFWKPEPAEGRRPSVPAAIPAAPAEDHTDDLYFVKQKARGKRRRRPADPDQLDLFVSPNAARVSVDPHKAHVVIGDGEADGSSSEGVDS
jgi:hypothetical protein